MKKICSFIIIILIFSSCSDNNDDTVNCLGFDPIFPDLYIRLIDENGANLIENGTINPNNITIDANFSSPSFQFVSPEKALFEEFNNTLALLIPNESTFRYTIHLGNKDSIDIDFTAELVDLSCGISFFQPNGVEYNNEVIELAEIETRQFLAVIKL